MNLRLALRVQGGLLLFLAATLLLPIPFGVWYGDGEWLAFLLSAALTGGVGALLLRLFRARHEVRLRDGFAIVTFAWILFAAFGSLPFLLSGTIPHPIGAFFETMSGFTTTGSTVISDLDVVAESILLWRALTHWIGGMGIIVLSIAILPTLGVGGVALFDAEMPGLTADRLRPRIRDTAMLLWGVYAFFTAAQTAALMFGGVSFLESLCHAFATMATGGFSTRDGSVGELGGTYVHVVTIAFMFLAGVNFTLHYRALRGRPWTYFLSDEFRFYGTIVLTATGVLFLANFTHYDDSLTNLRDSAFQVVSILTTTGFATADFELWAPVAPIVLLLLMFIGGCAGSTGGGLKCIRVLLLVKHAAQQVSRLIHPRQVKLLRVDGRPVSHEVTQSVLGFVTLYVVTLATSTLVLSALHLDLATAASASLACLSNIGPGIGSVGPAENFAHLPAAAHFLLALCMLVGRLEVFTVFVLFFPSFWRK